MIVFKAFRRYVPVVGVLVWVAALCAAASAEEARFPWWHLSTSSRPSYLQPGLARDEVQRFSRFAGPGGGFIESRGASLYGGQNSLRDKLNPNRGPRVPLAAGESPEEVQKALEGIYGAGNVEVTSTPPFETYEAKFVGELADQPVELMGLASCQKGPGCEATQVAAGRPDGLIVVNATNLGDASVEQEANPVTISDRLPAGLRAVGVYGGDGLELRTFELGECSIKTVSCTFAAQPAKGAPNVAPSHELQMLVAVDLNNGATSGEVNRASVTGGGAPSASASVSLTVSGAPVPFAVNTYEMRPEEPGGALDTQAGSHPFQFTTTLAFNETLEERIPPEDSSATGQIPFLSRPAGGMAKDLYFNLPAGLIGNPQAVPTCPLGTFLQGASTAAETCPADTVVGFAIANAYVTEKFAYQGPVQELLYNVEPAPGEPARFGFGVYEDPILLDTGVRTGSDYAVRVSATNITQTAEVEGSEVTFWGVPGDPRHDQQRCEEAIDGTGSCPVLGESDPPPFLSLPTSCAGPLESSMEGDLWAEAEPRRVFAPVLNTVGLIAPDGCNQLAFNPELNVEKVSERSSSTTGPTVDVHVPQEGEGNANALAQSAVKDIRVLLPEGMVLNPSAANGLQACSEGLVGFEPGLGTGGFEELNPLFEPGVRTPRFTAKLPSPLLQGVNFCPDASKVANVSITTPLLPAGQPVKGAIYLAAQGQNPFGSLIALYLVAEDPVSGSLVKLPGRVTLNEATGQIESVFEDQPQLPFEDAKVEFLDGNRSSLATPALCGNYTTEAQFTPWDGGPPRTSTSSFQITAGPTGGPCPNTPAEEPNTPTFIAQSENPVAGAYSPLVVHLNREDGSQTWGAINVTLPPGATGKIAGIPECSDAQIAQAQSRKEPGEGAVEAANPSCPASSSIGTVTVGAGYGKEPFYTTGNAYLAGPYEGAPYSAVFITPAIAGPFDLGVVVVRAGLYINPTTAQVTTKSDPLPTILHGVPLDIRSVTVNVNRPEFALNPTSCARMAVTGEEISTLPSTAPLSEPFQVGSCQSLSFHPDFTASTEGHTSKVNGASLKVRIGFHAGDANIRKVELTIPNVLPSRLTTLQKACTEKQFDSNPAGCPSASLIATAVAHTPLLNDPLSGPVYFVSHGGAAFPDTVMILQGDGVKLEVVGHTDIKNGVTYSRFETVPDAPVTSFEFNAPEGPYSIFGANANLCQSEIHMPTKITAQNGAVLEQSTLVEPEGCPNTLTVLSHSVKKRTITVKVAVPAAGKLTAGGRNLTTASKTARGRGTVTITLKAKGHGKVNTHVKLTFTPTKGRKLTAAIAARVTR